MTDTEEWLPNLGDTVRLNSGGPLMTVYEVKPRNGEWLVRCSWFTLDGQHLHDAWAASMLEPHAAD